MSDDELEKLIDQAGRDRVLARARALGWMPGSDVPRFVWQGIAYELALSQEPLGDDFQRVLDENRRDLYEASKGRT